MKRPTTTKAGKGSDWIRVPCETVAAIFEEHYPRGPWPTATECYRLANTIDIVRNKDLPPVKNANPGYRDRPKAFDAIFKLVEKQIENHKAYGEPQWPPLLQLKELQSRLVGAKSLLIGAPNPLLGERRGAEWHLPARILARWVEETLRTADRKKKYLNKRISRDKGGRFVLVVGDVLELAGFKKPGEAAIAAVLQKSPM